jgi:hypothetical protein
MNPADVFRMKSLILDDLSRYGDKIAQKISGTNFEIIN